MNKNVIVTVLIIVIFVLGVALGGVCVLLYNANKGKDDIGQVGNNMPNTNNAVANINNNQVNNIINNNENNTISGSTTIETTVANNQTISIFNKILNPNNDPNYSDNGDLVSCYSIYEGDGSDIVLTLTYDGKVTIYAGENSVDENAGMKLNANTNYEITGFPKKVADIFLGYYGQSVNYPIAFFILEDGTVWYLDTKSFMINGNTKVEGKLNGVEGVVKIKQADWHDSSGGCETVIGIKADGSFYNLINALGS